MTTPPAAKRITRIIARLNIGGPAIQAINLTHELTAHGYETRLVRGVESPSEGNMDYLAEERGVSTTLIDTLRRDPSLADLVTLVRLIRILRIDRPQIVHTHAAKAGTLGRLATLLAFPRSRSRPIMVHTFHGHSLTGYFSGRTAGFYRIVEKVLARWTDALIAVSDEVKRDLVELGVAPPGKFRVVPLGFDLSPFSEAPDRVERRARLRGEWGIPEDTAIVTLIARLVPIKRVDRFLEMASLVQSNQDVRFVVVGDGELREVLGSSPAAETLGARLVWAGFRRDVPDVCFASDVVALTSDNEGTPVSLIEAQAAGIPVVTTDVGGVRSAVRDGVSGIVIGAGDTEGLAAAATSLVDDAALRATMGNAGRLHATTVYTLSRLVSDHVNLYRELESRRQE